MSAAGARKLKTRVAGILFMASQKLAVDTLGYDELDAFVDCSGGTIDRRKVPYLAILPDVYGVVSAFTSVHKS